MEKLRLFYVAELKRVAMTEGLWKSGLVGLTPLVRLLGVIVIILATRDPLILSCGKTRAPVFSSIL